MAAGGPHESEREGLGGMVIRANQPQGMLGLRASLPFHPLGALGGPSWPHRAHLDDRLLNTGQWARNDARRGSGI